jgi:hypothetical protein
MGSYAVLNHTTYVSGYDLTGDTNGTSLDIEYDELDVTVNGNTGRNRIAGLESVESTVTGPWQSAASGAIDPTIFTGLGSNREVVTQTPTGTEGDVAWLWQARKFKYQIGGQLGEVFPYEMTMMSTKGSGTTSVGAVRGRLLKAEGDISGTGVTGSVVEAGAVASGQYLYCAVHCFSIGTSFTLQIQSDTASNFPSATTQMTTSSITATGGTWVTRVAGPITDTFWRVNVSAASGTSQIAVAIGIK